MRWPEQKPGGRGSKSILASASGNEGGRRSHEKKSALKSSSDRRRCTVQIHQNLSWIKTARARGGRLVPGVVRNGPVIDIEDLKRNDTVEGAPPTMIIAYRQGAQDKFTPTAAKAPAAFHRG